jgi:hypothetical protein
VKETYARSVICKAVLFLPSASVYLLISALPSRWTKVLFANSSQQQLRYGLSTPRRHKIHPRPMPHIPEKKPKNNVPLLQACDKIPLWSLGRKARNIEKTRPLVIPRSAICRNSISQDFPSSTRSLQLWRSSQTADQGYLGERSCGARCGGGEGTRAGGERATEEEGRHLECSRVCTGRLHVGLGIYRGWNGVLWGK